MKNISFKCILTFSCIMLISLFISSCGDDEVTGCMDPNAENFDPQATNDSNSCVFARDKFIGEYVGSFQCPGVLAAVDTDNIAFSIEPGLDADLFNQVIITLRDVSGFDIPLTANASGNSLSDINAELLGIPVLNITSDVIGTGEATLSADDQTLDAEVTLMITNLFGVTEGTCTLVGSKQ